MRTTVKTPPTPAKYAEDEPPPGFEAVTQGGLPWWTVPGEIVVGTLTGRDAITTKYGPQHRYSVRLSAGSVLTVSDPEEKGQNMKRPVEAGEIITFIEKADTRCLASHVGAEVWIKAGEKVPIRDGRQTMQSFRVAVSKVPF